MLDNATTVVEISTIDVHTSFLLSQWEERNKRDAQRLHRKLFPCNTWLLWKPLNLSKSSGTQSMIWLHKLFLEYEIVDTILSPNCSWNMKSHDLVAQTAKNIRWSIQPFLFPEFTSYKIACTYNTTYNMFQVDCKAMHMLDRKVGIPQHCCYNHWFSLFPF